MSKLLLFSFRGFGLGSLVCIGLGLFGCSSGQMESKSGEQVVRNEQINRSLTEFENRKIYTTLSEKNIDEIPDDKLELAIFDNIISKMNKEMSDEVEVFTRLSKPQQHFYAIWGVQAEVNNGGFNQYYFNSSGRYADVAADGFKIIGALKFADLMRRANDIYKKNEQQITSTHDGTWKVSASLTKIIP